jgi:NADH:ubiquinone oxidoreductase subunit 3 (subunit A)
VPSGWNIYYIVFFAGALSLVVPALLTALSFFVTGTQRAEKKGASSRPAEAALSVEENPTAPGKRTNPRAFTALNSALALLGIALLLLPCAVTLGSNPTLGLVCVLSLTLMAALALLYGIRKHDLEWLMSFRATDAATETVGADTPDGEEET